MGSELMSAGYVCICYIQCIDDKRYDRWIQSPGTRKDHFNAITKIHDVQLVHYHSHLLYSFVYMINGDVRGVLRQCRRCSHARVISTSTGWGGPIGRQSQARRFTVSAGARVQVSKHNLEVSSIEHGPSTPIFCSEESGSSMNVWSASSSAPEETSD
jgi:hypothetical protein